MEAIIIIIIGLALLFGAFKFKGKTKNISAQGTEAEGIVFDIVESDNIQSNAQYPVIRFVTSKKEWITQEYNIGISFNRYKKGQKVTVLYNPDNPKEFIIKSQATLLAPIAAIIIAIVLLVIGIYKLLHI